METRGDGSLVHESDFNRPERLEHVKSFDNLGLDRFPCNPRLVFLSIHATPFDEMQADVNDIDVVHLVAGAAGVGSTGEEAKDDGIKAISRVPIGSHALLAVRLAIFSGCLAILFDKPEEKVNEDDVWFTEAALLEGGAHLRQHCFKEFVGESGIHSYNVALVFLARACVALTVARSFSSVHPVKSGTLGALGGKGTKASG
jgi:hypothetical protein